MSHTFHWGLDGLDKSRFEAYTKILSLRNSGQADDAITFDAYEVGPDMIEPAKDDDSITGQPLTNFDNDKLKRAFLDRLSEILSHTRGGYQVAAALMIENLGVPEIVVAKNSGLKQTDKDFIIALEKVLVRMAGCPSVFPFRGCSFTPILIRAYSFASRHSRVVGVNTNSIHTESKGIYIRFAKIFEPRPDPPNEAVRFGYHQKPCSADRGTISILEPSTTRTK